MRQNLRAALAVGALWASLYGLHLLTNTVGDMDQVLLPISVAYRLADTISLPFVMLLALILSPESNYTEWAYYLAGSGMAAASIVATLLGLVRLRPSRLLLGLLAPWLLVGMALAFQALFVEPYEIHLRTFHVGIPDLPPALDGLRVAHISDSHLGPYVGSGRIRRAITLLNAQSPHLAVATGDFIHRSPAALRPGIALLGELNASYGTLAVMGNHEHWLGAAACRDALAAAGVTLLDNRCVYLSEGGTSETPGPAESLALCGVGDLWEGTVDPLAATRDVPAATPRLLLSHNPDVAAIFPARWPALRFDLQLSGHTHGGQVRLPLLGTPVVPSEYGARFAGGRMEGPAWPVIVSRGVGLAVAPVRLGAPPEVGIIVLHRQ